MNSIKNIVENVLGKSNIKHDQNLKEFGMDSTQFVRIIVSVELEYDIEFEDEDLLMSDLNTIKAFENRTKALIDKKGEK